MAAPDSKSRKRLDASYHSKQPHELVFFVDKCLGQIQVPNALRAAGERVEIKTDHFSQDAEDIVWVTEVGARGWIILSADDRLRHNHIEIVALLRSNTHSFLLNSGSLSGAQMASAFVTALPQIKGIVGTVAPPAVCVVSQAGSVRVKHTYDGLVERATKAAHSEARAKSQRDRQEPDS